MVGDFNATLWSAGLRAFLSDTGLHGFDTRAAWPVWLGFVGIPIDHAFTSADLRILDIETGPDIGSDHRPVMIDVAPAGPRDFRATPQGSQPEAPHGSSARDGIIRPRRRTSRRQCEDRLEVVVIGHPLEQLNRRKPTGEDSPARLPLNATERQRHAQPPRCASRYYRTTKRSTIWPDSIR